jgi:hypothetical protein
MGSEMRRFKDLIITRTDRRLLTPSFIMNSFEFKILRAEFEFFDLQKMKEFKTIKSFSNQMKTDEDKKERFKINDSEMSQIFE